MDIHEYLYPPEEKWTPPPEDDRFDKFREPVPETELPDYHEETLYQLSQMMRFSEGMVKFLKILQE